mgnify:CR=1 FL=1
MTAPLELSGDPQVHGLLETAPHVGGVPILVNLPAFLICMALAGLLVVGVSESAKVNNVIVAIKVSVLAAFILVGGAIVLANFPELVAKNWVPFIPENRHGEPFLAGNAEGAELARQGGPASGGRKAPHDPAAHPRAVHPSQKARGKRRGLHFHHITRE